MSLLKFVTEIIPQKTQVLITNSQSPLGSELTSQLSPHPNITVIECPDPTLSFPRPDSLEIVIHLAGFGSPSLAETLSHTAVLHTLLNLALSHNARFFLIVPNSRQHLYHTAITLVTQFSKNFSLPYQIIEIDKASSLPESAAAIIQKFVFGHRRPAQTFLPEKTHSVHRDIPSRTRLAFPKRRVTLNILKKFLTLFFIALSACWSAVALTALFSALLFVCSYKSLLLVRLDQASSCASGSVFLARISHALMPLAVGSSSASHALGLPPPETLRVLVSYTQSITSIQNLLAFGRQIPQGLFTSEAPSSSQLSKLAPYLSSVTELLAQFQTDLRVLYQTSTTPSTTVINLAAKFQDFHTAASKIQQILPQFDYLFQPDAKKTVLFLLHDPTQLMPSGGQIDTLIILTIKNQAILSAQVISSQAADAQLKGRADAPTDFRQATGASTWTLKESNWDPDFPTSARRIAWFVEKELSLVPDLIIGVNLTDIPHLLAVTGPVTVEVLSTTFSASNFSDQYLAYLKAHPHGPSPLPQLVQSLLTRLPRLKPTEWDRLLVTLLTSLETGQTLLAPHTFKASTEAVGWSGGLYIPPCTSALPCQSDILVPVFANRSGNKSDAYISSSAGLNISIDSQNITSRYVFTIQHQGLSDWPSGIHTSYLRFYLPPSAQLASISLNSTPLARSDYLLTSEHRLQSVGLLVATSPGNTTTLELSYTQSHSHTDRFHYQLALPLQPGLTHRPTHLVLTYPESWFVTSYLTPTVAQPGRLEYNNATQGQTYLNLDLTPSSTP